jgi:hypothetical protein
VSKNQEGLQEFGYLIQDKKETQNFIETYWKKLWARGTSWQNHAKSSARNFTPVHLTADANPYKGGVVPLASIC